MRYLTFLVLVVCTAAAGCGTAVIESLKAEVEQLEAKTADLEAKNAALAEELATARAQLAEIDQIKAGYEDARIKLGEGMKKLGPLLGVTESPMPPFDGLRDSGWVDKMMPSGNLPAGLQMLDELKGLPGEPGAAPDTGPDSEPGPNE